MLNTDAVAVKIKAERDKAGWTQTELAKRAGITPSALSQIESGERFPSTMVLAKLARTLSVSIDYLLGEKKDDEFRSIIHNEKMKSLFSGFKELSANDKESILKQIDWLNSRRKK